MASPEFASVRAPRIKAARRLGKRSFRRQQRRFLAEGVQAVAEALGHGAGVRELFVTAEAGARNRDLLDTATAAGVAVHQVTPEVMRELTQTVTPQGLLAVCEFVDVALERLPEIRLAAVLSQVRDPGNAGTVLRTADAAGADAVVFTDASVDPYNGKCVRATAGSLFHLPLSVDVGLASALQRFRAQGAQVFAADGAGDRDLDSLAADGRLADPTVWVFGNEAWGLPQDVLSQCDAVVRVPIYGAAESLNLASAAAVCLYATATAQRRR